MRKPQGPCRECGSRSPGCHGTCEKYAEFRDQLEEYKAAVRAARREDLVPGHRPWLRKSSKAAAEYRSEQKAERRRREQTDSRRRRLKHDNEE